MFARQPVSPMFRRRRSWCVFPSRFQVRNHLEEHQNRLSAVPPFFDRIEQSPRRCASVPPTTNCVQHFFGRSPYRLRPGLAPRLLASRNIRRRFLRPFSHARNAAVFLLLTTTYRAPEYRESGIFRLLQQEHLDPVVTAAGAVHKPSMRANERAGKQYLVIAGQRCDRA